ncbi:MAG: TonB family protein [Gammaproteobacteria bacterium]|nr:TonB family protein [Gammaproteobacteria bacterium]
MAWQQPAAKPPSRPKPVIKTKSKPIKEQKPKIKPLPKAVKKPVLTEKMIPEKIEPVPDPVKEPELKPEPIPLPEVTEEKEIDENSEEPLPVPAPIFKLTSLPRVLHQSPLLYPAAMREQGREAVVKLEILLDVKGKVRKVTITQSGGEVFDKAAIESMQVSTFLPGNINGKPVAVLLKKTIRFRLQ